MMTCEEILKALRDGKAVKRRNENYYFLLADDAIIEHSIKDNEWVFSNLSFGFRLDEIKKGVFDFEIYKKPILNKAEKEFLSSVVKPFSKDYKITVNKHHLNGNKEYITICFFSTEHIEGIDYLEGMVNLPQFKVGTMYQGMEANKEYSLEELGL